MKSNHPSQTEQPSHTEEPRLGSNPTAYELATLAARMCPGYCRTNPEAAIEEAMSLVAAVGKVIESKRQGDELRGLAEKFDQDHPAPFEFEKGVKFITGEKTLTRAMPWYRRFERSQGENADQQIALRRANGFTTIAAQVMKEKFEAWKPGARSEQARHGGLARAAKGRSRGKRKKK